MKNKFVLIRYVLMLWMLCGASYTQSVASAYDRTSPSASWGYQPLHVSSSVNSSVYGRTVPGGRTVSGAYSSSNICSRSMTQPSYQFASTSVYLDGSRFDRPQKTLSSGALLGSGWGDPDDDDSESQPIGSVTPTPVGSPLILLAFAILYIAFRQKRKKNCIFF